MQVANANVLPPRAPCASLPSVLGDLEMLLGSLERKAHVYGCEPLHILCQPNHLRMKVTHWWEDAYSIPKKSTSLRIR